MLTSYLQFHLVLTIPPLLLLACLVWPEKKSRMALSALLFICVAAFVWTAPWDNLLIMMGIWSYPENTVLGRIGYVPIEEYLFFIIQSCFTGLIYFAARGRMSFSQPAEHPQPKTPLAAALPSIWLAVLIGSVACLAFTQTLYLGLILVWAAPILLLQSLYGAREIERNRRPLFLIWLCPTLYLCLADAWAIHSGIWTINPATSTGLMIGPLPIEEAIFFALTNLMVIQGVLCFEHAWETRFERIRALFRPANQPASAANLRSL